MKAIGAQNSSVLSLFMAEALMIGIIGGTLGLLLGIAGGYVLMAGVGSAGGPDEGANDGTNNAPTNLSPVFLPADLVTVWGISVGLSLVAGIYPAWKAARLSPIVALRRE